MNKKEIKKQYKETVQPMGVFQIKNNQNSKIFIASSKNIHGKLNRTKFELKNGTYSNKEIQKDYNNAGDQGFSVDVLDILDPKEDLNYDYSDDLKTLEEMWLEKVQPYGDKGYNKKSIK
jgi:hypothetical protein